MRDVTAELIRHRDLACGLGRGRLTTMVRRRELQRVSRGVYAPASPIAAVDRLRALFLRLPEGTVLGFHSAAAIYGFGILRTDRVHVVIPAGVAKPRIRGVTAHEAALAIPEPVLLNGIPCAPAARCVLDLVRTVRRLDALAVVDAALRARVCDMDDLMREASRHAGLRGVRQARELVPLGDGRAECRQESQLRLIIIDGSLPVPESQLWVPDEFGVDRYRIDLGYRDQRIGVEYDGVSHLDRERFRDDRVRMNWLASRGWTMRYFTDADLYGRPASIILAVRAALSA
jgi:hypothetical protein